MMRAGKLDRIIVIERVTTTVDEYGTPVEGWTTVATVRAQLIQQGADEFMASYGTSTETAVVFRIRHMDGLTLADRVTYDARVYDMKEIKELGRRDGLELRCVSHGAT